MRLPDLLAPGRHDAAADTLACYYGLGPHGQHASFTGARFDNATCAGAAFVGCRLDGVQGVAGLRGAKLQATDLWGVAHLLAGALGIDVVENDPTVT